MYQDTFPVDLAINDGRQSFAYHTAPARGDLANEQVASHQSCNEGGGQ